MNKKNLPSPKNVTLPADMRPVLQYRWNPEERGGKTYLRNYGFQNPTPDRRQNLLLSPAMVGIIGRFDGVKTLAAILQESPAPGKEDSITALNDYIANGIIVDSSKRLQPAARDNYRTCVKCVNNDYVIPGLQFNEQGVCGCCQVMDLLKDKRIADIWSEAAMILTEKELIEKSRANKSRFDAMVMYTGGKDSSYLLWYVAKKLGLRVLACNWDLPFANEASLRNMEAARRKLPNVEFVTRTVRWDDMKKICTELTDLRGYPCMCYDTAHVLFYPLAVQEKIPYILPGSELSQVSTHALYMYLYNPELYRTILFGAKTKRDRLILEKIQRSRPTPIDITMKYLSIISQPDKAQDFMKKMQEVAGSIFTPLRETLKKTKPRQLPLTMRLVKDFSPEVTWKDLNKVTIFSNWKEVVEILQTELDWRMPEGQQGKLHTSCKIERAKDFSQIQRFRQMQTVTVPQHIVEISAAVYFGVITREEGLRDLSERGYYTKPDEFDWLMDKLELTPGHIKTMKGVLPGILYGEGCDSCLQGQGG